MDWSEVPLGAGSGDLIDKVHKTSPFHGPALSFPLSFPTPPFPFPSPQSPFSAFTTFITFRKVPPHSLKEGRGGGEEKERGEEVEVEG